MLFLDQIFAHIVGDIRVSAPYPKLFSCQGDVAQDTLCVEASCYKGDSSHPDHLTAAVGFFSFRARLQRQVT